MRCINKVTTLGLRAFENPTLQYTIYNFVHDLIYSQGNKVDPIAWPSVFLPGQSLTSLFLSLLTLEHKS